MLSLSHTKVPYCEGSCITAYVIYNVAGLGLILKQTAVRIWEWDLRKVCYCVHSLDVLS